MPRKKLEDVSEAAKTTQATTSAVSSDDVAEMKRMLSQGKTLRQIAEACGISHVTVRSKLLKHKAKMRKPGRKPFVSGPKLESLVSEGYSRKEIAAQMGVSESTVCRAMARSAGGK